MFQFLLCFFLLHKSNSQDVPEKDYRQCVKIFHEYFAIKHYRLLGLYDVLFHFQLDFVYFCSIKCL